MSNSTKAFSEDPVAAAALPPGQMVGPDGKVMQMPDIANPHANLELTEEELEEIYSRPYMNPAHAQYGCDPQSNKILEQEKALIEAKQEKCQELIKQNGEIYDILQTAKTDKNVLAMTGGREIDVGSVTNLLFSD